MFSRKARISYPRLSQNNGMICLVLMSSVITCKDWPDPIFSKIRSVTTFGRGHTSPLISSVLSTFGPSSGMAASLLITASQRISLLSSLDINIHAMKMPADKCIIFLESRVMGEDSCTERDNCRQQPVPIALTEENSGKACCPSIAGEIEQM